MRPSLHGIAEVDDSEGSNRRRQAGHRATRCSAASTTITSTGGKDDDQVDGGKGNDHVYGDAGNDVVSGGIGNDHINGGEGDDDLSGEAGHDRFVFEGMFGNDTITDFDVKNDTLHINGTTYSKGNFDQLVVIEVDATTVLFKHDEDNSITRA